VVVVWPLRGESPLPYAGSSGGGRAVEVSGGWSLLRPTDRYQELPRTTGPDVQPRPGDVIEVTRHASVQFTTPIRFRVIRVRDWPT
jgi:hypothetical protein